MGYEIPDEVIDAIKNYNKYRSPEATAEIISYKDDVLTVRFTGSFCFTCGVNDWIEDLKYVLEDYGVEAEITEIIEESETSRIARFNIRKIGVRRP